MMKRATIVCFLILIFATVPASAGDRREIELNDGSIITGEVLSLTNGIYTIKSDSLGIIKLEEGKVRTIRTGASARIPAQKNNQPGTGSGFQALQEETKQKMMRDEDIMNKIQMLQNDPEFQKALQDPEIMEAVNSGDIKALMANPRFMNLLNNSSVHEIEKKLR